MAEISPVVTVTRRTIRLVAISMALGALTMILAMLLLFAAYNNERNARRVTDSITQAQNACRAQASADALQAIGNGAALLLETSVVPIDQRDAAVNHAAAMRILKLTAAWAQAAETCKNP